MHPPDPRSWAPGHAEPVVVVELAPGPLPRALMALQATPLPVLHPAAADGGPLFLLVDLHDPAPAVAARLAALPACRHADARLAAEDPPPDTAGWTRLTACCPSAGFVDYWLAPPNKKNPPPLSIPRLPARRLSERGAPAPLHLPPDPMRYMLFRMADADSEAGVLPSEALLNDMTDYMETLAKAGVLLGGEGLRDSSHGLRLHFDGDGATVVDGPFAETKELIAGYALLQTRSLDEAIEWARRWPAADGDARLEIHEVDDEPIVGADARGGLRVFSLYTTVPDDPSAEEMTQEEMAQMGAFIGEAFGAGVVVETAGLRGERVARLAFHDGVPTVTVDTPSGPVARGYSVYAVASMDEAVEWTRRFGRLVGTGTAELRPLFEDDDFGDAFTPEAREREARLRETEARNRP